MLIFFFFLLLFSMSVSLLTSIEHKTQRWSCAAPYAKSKVWAMPQAFYLFDSRCVKEHTIRCAMCALLLTATCTRTGTTCSLRHCDHCIHFYCGDYLFAVVVAGLRVTCTDEGFVSARPRVSAGSPVDFELSHRSTEERPESRLFLVRRVCSQGACATTKFKRQPGVSERCRPS